MKRLQTFISRLSSVKAVTLTLDPRQGGRSYLLEPMKFWMHGHHIMVTYSAASSTGDAAVLLL
jgi:hypothetical protein